MGYRSTLALFAALLALGVYVWWVEIRGAEQRQAAESAERRIFAVAPASVTRIALDTSDGKRAVLTRNGAADWQLESPVKYPADAQAVEGVLRPLEKLESTAVIAERPADLEPFGLGAKRKSVELSAGDAAPQTLHLGGPTPVGGGRYVELGSDPKRLFTVSASALSGLEPSLLELRDRRILRLATGAADEVSVRAGGATVVQARKTDAGWQLVAPEAAPADPERIRRLLDDLALARASAFEDAPRAAATYGLEKPALEIAVRAGEAEEKLALGEADGRTWVRREGDPVLLEANERVRTGVPTAYFDYRAKRVLSFEAEAVRALEIAFPRVNQSHRVTREAESWKAAEAGVELKPLVAEDLVYALAALDATGVEPESADRKRLGLEPAAVVVKVFDAQDAPLGELALGDPQQDRGLPALSSQSPLVWLVATDLGREVPLSPEAWTNLFVKPPEAAPPAPSAP